MYMCLPEDCLVWVSTSLLVRASGFVMSDLLVRESWFVLTVSALTGTVTGALNKAVSFLWLVSSLKNFFCGILDFGYYGTTDGNHSFEKGSVLLDNIYIETIMLTNQKYYTFSTWNCYAPYVVFLWTFYSPIFKTMRAWRTSFLTTGRGVRMRVVNCGGVGGVDIYREVGLEWERCLN